MTRVIHVPRIRKVILVLKHRHATVLIMKRMLKQVMVWLKYGLICARKTKAPIASCQPRLSLRSRHARHAEVAVRYNKSKDKYALSISHSTVTCNYRSFLVPSCSKAIASNYLNIERPRSSSQSPHPFYNPLHNGTLPHTHHLQQAYHSHFSQLCHPTVAAMHNSDV